MYLSAQKFPKRLKELLMGVALGGFVIINGFRNGGKSTSVKRATRALWFEVVTELGSRKAARQFEQLRGRKGLKLHLGCGYDIRSGWVNIDAFSTPPDVKLKDINTFAIQYDLRQPIPLENSSSSYIYSSHFWEHLYPEDGYNLFKEGYRLLETGGKFRISLPDFETIFKFFINRDETYFIELHKSGFVSDRFSFDNYINLDTVISHVVFQDGEHKTIYTPKGLTDMLRQIGFSTVNIVDFDQTVDVNTEVRKAYSFYVEAVK